MSLTDTCVAVVVATVELLQVFIFTNYTHVFRSPSSPCFLCNTQSATGLPAIFLAVFTWLKVACVSLGRHNGATCLWGCGEIRKNPAGEAVRPIVIIRTYYAAGRRWFRWRCVMDLAPLPTRRDAPAVVLALIWQIIFSLETFWAIFPFIAWHS